MVAIQGGTFQMGSENGNDDEKPVHNVKLHNFYIGKYEVTQAQWKVIMGKNRNYFKGDNLPVENVSWNDVQKFLLKLNALTNKTYRLPTEAEWEYAAGYSKSSATGHTKWAGTNNESTIDNFAWYDSNSNNTTHAVGTKQPNELGLYDMSGNLWEWCSDWYDNYSNYAQISPTGPISGSHRVSRGGGWSRDAQYCRVTSRSGNLPEAYGSHVGFRLVYSDKL